MTNREIVLACLNNEPGPVPQWNMGFYNRAVAEKLAPGHIYPSYYFIPDEGSYSYGPLDDSEREAVIRFNACVGKCAVGVGRGANSNFGHGGPGEFGCSVEDRGDNWFSVRYETGARHYYQLSPHYYHVSDVPVRQLSDLEDLHLPDAADDARYSGFAEDVAYFRGRGEFTYGNINGFFSGLHYFLMGYEDVLMAFHVEQDLVRELLRLLGEWNLTAAQKMLEAGVDCIALCDDLGTGESMLISPDTYREFIKPWHTKLNRLVHSYEGRYTHLHSHGNINAVLPDLVEAGFDILNPLDPGDNMNVVDVKARFGATLTLAGGLDKMFFNWPADRCREHLANLVLACGGRGYMLMESSGVSDDVTSEDWQEFLGVSREVRRLNH